MRCEITDNAREERAQVFGGNHSSASAVPRPRPGLPAFSYLPSTVLALPSGLIWVDRRRGGVSGMEGVVEHGCTH